MDLLRNSAAAFSVPRSVHNTIEEEGREEVGRQLPESHSKKGLYSGKRGRDGGGRDCIPL